MITSPKMLGILIDHTTRTAAPRRHRKQSSFTSWAWLAAFVILSYFAGRMYG